ncbi:MAG: HU family DNA-binding protein [Rhodothermales bacterium]|nr:HU family DNA-binding protein [Rhodothermales bacterium]
MAGGRAFSTAPPLAGPVLRTAKHSGPVTKADIIDHIATATGLTKIETEAVVNGFITTVMQALTEGDSVELRGFGAFRTQYRAPRVARNPRTKEVVEIEARTVPVFRPSKDFRDAVDRAAHSQSSEE